MESFVDAQEFAGTCYQASNWIHVGQTQGRGRQDQQHQGGRSIKDIYVYPLVDDWRDRLGVAEPAAPCALALDEGLSGEDWVALEFGDAPLGDRRLSKRLVDSARRQAALPGRTFTAVAKGDWPATKGYYRLIDQPADSATTMAAILQQPHQQRTQARLRGQSRVLCIQDDTTLTYTNLAQCKGLGVTDKNQTGAQSWGMDLHTTLAINGEGIPLGIVDARCRKQAAGAKVTGRKKPLEEKSTFDWVAGLRQCAVLAEQMPQTHFTRVMDREADFFELFDAQREHPQVDILVRAKHDRSLGEGRKLFDHVRTGEVRGKLGLTVARRSARPKRSKQKAQAGRAMRQTILTLRYTTLTLPPPAHLRGKEPLTLSMVQAVEEAPPEGVKPLEWLLLSSREINSIEDAEQCLQDYTLRWRIEDWHRVLKPGCRVEKLAHQQVERLERALAINMVIAWHIMVMTLLSREVPTLPADVLFSDLELEVLKVYANTLRLSESKRPGRSGADGRTSLIVRRWLSWPQERSATGAPSDLARP